MRPLPFAEARELVVDTVRRYRQLPQIETVHLDNATGRVLAQNLLADRDYPPFPRSIRDGFAVRSSDFPGSVTVVGEVRAGTRFEGFVQPGQAVEIMTGAPLPEGADAVLMVEHADRQSDVISSQRQVVSGDFVVPQGAEIAARAVAMEAGTRIDFGNVPAIATSGADKLAVFKQPTVAILATGDELVPVEARPLDHQIRNSNSHALAAQVLRAGAIPQRLPVARDDFESTRTLIRRGLQSDLLLLSGGVSAGKYDVVENVLAEFGAEFFFDRVLIQPGQPLVFGRVGETFFFGLPGNPASTMVTFELFARAAIDLISGCNEAPLPLTYATLRSELQHKPGLTRFLPARIAVCGRDVEPVRWQGSGDVFALARANALVVARQDRPEYRAGDLIEVLLR